MSTPTLERAFAPAMSCTSPSWPHRLLSPLWIFVLLAALVRIYLIIHGQGVVDGDEALVGIQAQHILRGEWPVYFYGQAYMGSLEAYLVALLFALFGSSVWILRLEPFSLSLLVVALTWRLAGALAKRALLPSFAEKCFIWSATAIATFLPLYDIIIELRTYGGYIETLVVMLLLLYAALQLMDRWQAGAGAQELAWRWAGIGFLIGLGFWIDPLVIYAIAAIAVWIGTGILQMAIRWYVCAIQEDNSRFSPKRRIFRVLRTKPWLVSIFALPAACVGAAPAFYWGANHHWANIRYILQQGSHEPLRQRIRTIWHVVRLSHTCLAERIIGGGIPVEEAWQRSLHTWLSYAGLLCFLVTASILIIGLWKGKTTFYTKLKQMSRAVSLPLLFGIGTIAIFCASSAATIGLQYPCTQDFVGRYASPILLVLPFFFAATLTIIMLFFQHSTMSIPRFGCNCSRFIQIIALIAFCFYTMLNSYSYQIAGSHYLFQSPYCLVVPADNAPLIDYLQREHIRYAWANNFVGNPITFKTASQIIAVDPLGVLIHQDWLNRMPDYTKAVQHADLPSIILLVRHEDRSPQLFSLLKREHIAFRSARFPAQPAQTDVIVVTPLTRNIPVLEAPQDFVPIFACA